MGNKHSKTKKIEEELEIIRKKHKGLLRPIDIVKYAENPETSLHLQFEWDDGKAAQEYRLGQARYLIRVFVTVLGEKKNPIRAYVSLIGDRIKVNGGYRELKDVLRTKNGRTQLLQQAFREFMAWKNKYEVLKELSSVFEEGLRLSKGYLETPKFMPKKGNKRREKRL